MFGAGYVKVTDEIYYNYVFNYTDHLGNIRATWAFDDREDAVKILEENHYYPFGLKHKTYNTVEYTFIEPSEGMGFYYPVLEQTGTRDNKNPYKYKYNGKEWQDELGLNTYDYGARNYEPAIGRWMNIDPLTEKYKKWSPYTYAMNNPIYFIDPDGKRILIGKKTYSYQENRDYSAFKSDFERETYRALDMLYSSKAMNITIGEGENAKKVNILDQLINDKDNKITIKEGKESMYNFKNKKLFFNHSQGIG